jgi:hypothetical protein
MTHYADRIELVGIQGEHLSAVTFVQDYVQLQFDGPTITAITRPVVRAEGAEFEFDTPGYRDQLCSFITKIVRRATVWRGDRLQLDFGERSVILVSLRPENYRAAEAVIFRDERTTDWAVW